MKRKLIYTCIFIVLISCLNQEWDNPFDENCPKETWTPSNFSATQEESSIVLNWEQSVTNISGFKIERKIEGESWANSTTVGANARTWEDSEIEDGKNHEYRLTALADENESNSVTTQLFPLLAPTLQTLEVTSIGTNSATLNGSVNANGDTAKVIFEYGTSSLYGDSIIAIPETVTGETVVSVSADLSNLIPGINYYVRIKAINSLNNTSYGNNITFITQHIAPEAITEEVTYITDISATLNGSVNANGGVTQISFDYGLTDSYGQSINATPDTLTGKSLTNVYSNLTDLLPGKTYYYRIKAENSAGVTYGESFTFTTQESSSSNLDIGVFTDPRDGKKYKIVKIGEQWWMAENLAYLPSVSPPDEGSTSEPHYYVYGYNGTNVSEAKATTNYLNFGVLYNWSAVMQGESCSYSNPSGVQGVAPIGWHIPSDKEWEQLASYLGSAAGGKMKAVTGWESPNTGADNSSGFSGLPGGRRYSNDNSFHDIGTSGTWRSTNEQYTEGAGQERNTSANYTLSYYSDRFITGGSSTHSQGYSVRCVKD